MTFEFDLDDNDIRAMIVERIAEKHGVACTQAAAQTMTLPAATATPIGMEAHFVSEGGKRLVESHARRQRRAA